MTKILYTFFLGTLLVLKIDGMQYTIIDQGELTEYDRNFLIYLAQEADAWSKTAQWHARMSEDELCKIAAEVAGSMRWLANKYIHRNVDRGYRTSVFEVSSPLSHHFIYNSLRHFLCLQCAEYTF